MPKVVAFYLPQFHQIPENDAWHGEGFTEWTVVAKSKPLFPGHRQPELPGELGFYDLRVPESRLAQAALARNHGIRVSSTTTTGSTAAGFSRDRSMKSWRRDPRIFRSPCAGQTKVGTGVGRGPKDELILEQEFNEEDDLAHIRWLITCFKDPRYIRVKGRPLLAGVQGPTSTGPQAKTVELWSNRMRESRRRAPVAGHLFETSEAARCIRPCIGIRRQFGVRPAPAADVLRFHDGRPAQDQDASNHDLTDYVDVASGYLNRPRPVLDQVSMCGDRLGQLAETSAGGGADTSWIHP